MFRKFYISNRLPNRYFPENCRWVPLSLNRRISNTILPSSGRLSVYQDATRACIKVPWDTSIFLLGWWLCEIARNQSHPRNIVDIYVHFAFVNWEWELRMATSKKVGGKVINYKLFIWESPCGNKWRSQNLRQGYDKLPDSEFAEVLLQ